MNIVERLKQAAAAGEVLDVIYHGGSQSGAQRKLAPIRVNGNKFHAKCMETNTFKFYMIEKLEIVGEPLPLPDDWQPDRVTQYDKNKYRGADHIDPDQFIQHTMPSIINAGWYAMDNLHLVTVNNTNYPAGTIQLFSFFKNGKPKKNPNLMLVIQHWEPAYDFLPIREDAPLQPKARPYSVYGDCKGKAFSSFEPAAAYFYEQSKILAAKYFPD